MNTRIFFAAAAAIALTTVAPSAAEAQCFGTPLADNSSLPVTGCTNDIILTGDFSVTYVGSSASYWHSLWVFTPDQLTGSLPASPINPGVSGQLITCKFIDCTVNGTPSPLQSQQSVLWGGGTAIFGLYVIPTATGTYPADGYNGEGYWLFSGTPSRNPDNAAHAAYFDEKVLNDDRVTTLADVGAQGYDFLLGFEDQCAEYEYNDAQQLTCSADFGGSDWDFNDAVFGFNVPTDTSEVVPEPATMTLLATGLVGMAAARRRRRNNG